MKSLGRCLSGKRIPADVKEGDLLTHWKGPSEEGFVIILIGPEQPMGKPPGNEQHCDCAGLFHGGHWWTRMVTHTM